MSSNLPATKSPVKVFSEFMDKLKPQLALALPKHLSADRMSRLALTAFSTSPQLRDCDMKSIAASIMTAGQLGLEPGVNGAGFLIPYGKTCTFVPGWKGLVDLVARSGRGTVYSGVIFKDQQYTFIDGARRDLIIHNETDLDDPNDITHAFAIGWVKDASMPIIELWRVSKITKHRDKYNKVGKKHYSFRDWEMYCRKVPLLQVLKYMPCSIEVANAMAISHASEAGRSANIEDGIVIDIEPSEQASSRKTEIASRFTQPAAEAGSAEIPMTAEEVAEVTPEPKPEAADTADLLQTVYRAITDLAYAKGETPDDMLDSLTNGKLSALVDLEDKPAPYLNDILLMVQAKAAG